MARWLLLLIVIAGPVEHQPVLQVLRYILITQTYILITYTYTQTK